MSATMLRDSEPAVERDPASRRNGRWQTWAWYAAVGLTACLLVVVWVQLWAFPDQPYLVEAGDSDYMLGMFQIHADAGIVGTTDHLAWPDGASAWSYPQLGAFAGLFAWITVGLFGMAAATALWLFLAVAAGLNAMAMLFFLRSVAGTRFPLLTAALALTTGASIGTASYVWHANLALWPVIPLALGVLIRWPWWDRRRQLGALAAVAATAAVSPMWWVVVVALMLPFFVVPFLVRGQWSRLVGPAATLGAVVAGVAAQFLLHKTAGGVLSDVSIREPWQSNEFGGYLVDLFLAAPLLQQVGWFDGLGAGASAAPFLVGIVGVAAAVLAIGSVLALPGLAPDQAAGSAEPGQARNVLGSASVVALLFFLAGGLGNLQAGVAVLGGTISPARVWLRMLLVLAIVGTGWFVWLVRKTAAGHHRRLTPLVKAPVVNGVAVVVLGLYLLDLQAATPEQPLPQSQLPEGAAVEYLRQSHAPCRVAQLPVDSLPTRLWGGWENVHRGLIPYVMAPEYWWSYASYPDGTAAVNDLPTTLTTADFERLRAAGFCAVLFDKDLARRATGAREQFQGQVIPPAAARPSFESPRFDVYDLATPTAGS